MNIITLTLIAALSIPTVSQAGDFRCRRSVGDSITCRDNSLFSDTTSETHLMQQMQQQRLHNQMQMNMQMNMDASRRAAEDHNQLMMQIIQLQLQNRNR